MLVCLSLLFNIVFNYYCFCFQYQHNFGLPSKAKKNGKFQRGQVDEMSLCLILGIP